MVDLYRYLEMFSSLLEASQRARPPLDEGLVGVFPGLSGVLHRFERLPYAAVLEGRSRLQVAVNLDALGRTGFLDRRYGPSRVEVLLEYLSSFRETVLDAEQSVGDFYVGFLDRYFSLAIRHGQSRPLSILSDESLLREAYVSAVTEDEYRSFRESFWVLESSLLYQDLSSFPEYASGPDISRFLDGFEDPHESWEGLRLPLLALKEEYDAQTAQDVLAGYLSSS